jgi:hypothetical protein
MEWAGVYLRVVYVYVLNVFHMPCLYETLIETI